MTLVPRIQFLRPGITEAAEPSQNLEDDDEYEDENENSGSRPKPLPSGDLRRVSGRWTAKFSSVNGDVSALLPRIRPG